MSTELPEGPSTAELSATAADELGAALRRAGVPYQVCVGEGEIVAVAFEAISGAEKLIGLIRFPSRSPGTLYDRATEGCVSLTTIPDVTPELARGILRASWTWNVHPVTASGGRLGWHVAVDMPYNDALTVAASLNAAGRS